MISLPLRNKISLSKLEAVVCESYGLLFAWSSFGALSQRPLGKKWYKAHILLGQTFKAMFKSGLNTVSFCFE